MSASRVEMEGSGARDRCRRTRRNAGSRAPRALSRRAPPSTFSSHSIIATPPSTLSRPPPSPTPTPTLHARLLPSPPGSSTSMYLFAAFLAASVLPGMLASSPKSNRRLLSPKAANEPPTLVADDESLSIAERRRLWGWFSKRTSYPTRYPTVSTKYPTRCVDHCSSPPKLSCSSRESRSPLTAHVSLPNSYPTGYPTAYPTAYPTSFPTPPPSPVCKCGAATFRTSGGKMCSTTQWHGGLYFTTSWSGSSSPNSNCNNKRDEATNYLARDVCPSCGKCIGGQSTCTGAPTTVPTPIPTYPPGEGTSVRNFMLA